MRSKAPSWHGGGGGVRDVVRFRGFGFKDVSGLRGFEFTGFQDVLGFRA